MKKFFVISAMLSMALLTSCKSTQMQSQEMPPVEQEWADTLQNWYPDWTPPVIIRK